MFRKSFLKASAVAGALALASTLTMPASHAQQAMSENAAAQPIRIIMGGYGPPTTSFSVALKQIGDRLEAKFPGQVEVRYVYNIMDLENLHALVGLSNAKRIMYTGESFDAAEAD